MPLINYVETSALLLAETDEYPAISGLSTERTDSISAYYIPNRMPPARQNETA